MDPLIIAGTKLNSRLIAGTSGYPNQQVLLDALDTSGAEIVTASIRRISLEGYAESLIDVLGGHWCARVLSCWPIAMRTRSAAASWPMSAVPR